MFKQAVLNRYSVIGVSYPKALKYQNKIYRIQQAKYKKGNEVWYVDLGEQKKVAEIDSEQLQFLTRNETDHGNVFESVYTLPDNAKLVSNIWKDDLE